MRHTTDEIDPAQICREDWCEREDIHPAHPNDKPKRGRKAQVDEALAWWRRHEMPIGANPDTWKLCDEKWLLCRICCGWGCQECNQSGRVWFRRIRFKERRRVS